MDDGTDRSRLVTGEHGGIKYRAYPYTGLNDDGSITWQIEYQQNPRDGYFGPRGSFREKDGKFHLDGKVFDSARLAMMHRAVFG